MEAEKRLNAYAGKILRVNLSDGKTTSEPTSDYAREWLGASGFAIKILYDELRAWVTPYEPANKIVFSAGTLQGTTAPGACKSNLSTLGPMTGGWATGSSDCYVGGQLKYAGYDSVIIEGRAIKPVFLWICDDRIELRDASHLWGKTTWETLTDIRQELGDETLHALSIGPAGEHLARGGCVIQDRGRAFGRCGTGAVMGSKNLKAIVARGTGAIRVAEPKRFMETVSQIRERFQSLKGVKLMQKYGTLGVIEGKQRLSGLNYKNFQENVLPEEMMDLVDPRKVIDKYQISRQSSPGCAIGCGRRLRLTDGPYAGLETECGQMETFLTLQTRLAIEEPTFWIKANAYCNQMGLDIDAAGGAIGWAMECYQRGILTEADTDGLKLEWGNAEVALELMRKISYREGFGNLLAEGCARASDLLGRNSDYYCLHIKGQDLYEPCRGSLGWALGTTTSTRGGGHTTGAIIDTRIVPDVKDQVNTIFGVKNPFPLEYEDKAKMVTYMEVVHRVNNCFGICHINTIHNDFDEMDLPHLAELYSAATGWETSVEDLKHMATKQINLEKAFNLRHTNLVRKDDLPTPRDLSEPISGGALAGWKMDEQKYNQMLDDYYDLHGWDRQTSYPKRKTLEELGLGFVADDLAKIGKLR